MFVLLSCILLFFLKIVYLFDVILSVAYFWKDLSSSWIEENEVSGSRSHTNFFWNNSSPL